MLKINSGNEVKICIVNIIAYLRVSHKGKGSLIGPLKQTKPSTNKGGDVFLAYTSTHVDHDVWFCHSTRLLTRGGFVNIESIKQMIVSLEMV